MRRAAIVVLLLSLQSGSAWAIESEGPAQPPGALPATAPEVPGQESGDPGLQGEDEGEPGYRYLPQTPLLRNAQRRQRAQARQSAAVTPEQGAVRSAQPEQESRGPWLFLGLLAIGLLGGSWVVRRLSYV